MRQTNSTIPPPENQLSLDFSRTSSREDTVGLSNRVGDRASHLTVGESVFHPESSEIGPYTFALKLSYKGRSFLIKGGYRRDRIRSFSDPSFSSIIVGVIRIESIGSFRNGRYNVEFISKHDHEGIERKVREILSSPLYNTHLATEETLQ